MASVPDLHTPVFPAIRLQRQFCGQMVQLFKISQAAAAREASSPDSYRSR